MPLHHINWQTPYELLNDERPSISHLKVFGCGAYVFLPAEVRANKLAPRSELMVYLGNARGAGGYIFMRSPNDLLFYSTYAIFDESMFPKCHTMAKKPNIRLLEKAPTYQYHKDTIPVDEEEIPSKSHTSINKGKEHQMNRPHTPPVEESEEEQQMPPVPRTLSPQGREVPPAPPSAPE